MEQRIAVLDKTFQGTVEKRTRPPPIISQGLADFNYKI